MRAMLLLGLLASGTLHVELHDAGTAQHVPDRAVLDGATLDGATLDDAPLDGAPRP